MSGLISRTVTMRSLIPLAFSSLLPLSTLSPLPYQHTYTTTTTTATTDISHNPWDKRLSVPPLWPQWLPKHQHQAGCFSVPGDVRPDYTPWSTQSSNDSSLQYPRTQRAHGSTIPASLTLAKVGHPYPQRESQSSLTPGAFCCLLPQSLYNLCVSLKGSGNGVIVSAWESRRNPCSLLPIAFPDLLVQPPYFSIPDL